MKALLIALICLLATACMGPNQVDLPTSLTIDPAFDAEQAQVVVLAAQQWRDATAGAADLRVSVSPSGGVHVFPNVHPNMGTIEPMGITTVQASDAATIELRPGAVDEWAASYHQTPSELLSFVVLHELGHVFGLDHAATGLMQAADNTARPIPPCIDAAALAVFCSNYVCTTAAHPTCE